MTSSVVRCPYCVSEDHFKPMVRHLDGRFICEKCGHVAFPTDPAFKCWCYRCQTTFGPLR